MSPLQFQKQLRLQEARRLMLAEALGATVVRLSGTDVAGPLLAYARKHNVTRLIIGKPTHSRMLDRLRGSLLDELGKQYVVTARAKGVRERKLIFKFPVRIAINPIVSTIGWQLPHIVSGETIVAIVLSLPTTGPLLYRALLSQDMFMAGSIVLLLGALTLIGTFVSDLLLVFIDPRISFERKA